MDGGVVTDAEAVEAMRRAAELCPQTPPSLGWLRSFVAALHDLGYELTPSEVER
jgi:hypothetical protein